MLLAAVCLSRRDRCPNCRVTPILRGFDFGDRFLFSMLHWCARQTMYGLTRFCSYRPDSAIALL